MTPASFALEVFAISMVAGALGAIVGIGGGIVVVPALTLLFGIDIRYAIGASIVSVIATSSGSAAAYVRQHIVNLRVAMLLELGTTTGALTGAYLAGILSGRWLFIVFGVMMGYSALMMLRQHRTEGRTAPPDKLSDALKLHGSYFDEATGRQEAYQVTRAPLGLALMWIAGVVSGLLGIGSGALKVPALDLAMRVPIKVSTATSNLMIGVTAAASAAIYFARGDIIPFVAAPVAAGVLLGATAAARIFPKLQSQTIRIAFVAVLVWVSLEMLAKGIRA